MKNTLIAIGFIAASALMMSSCKGGGSFKKTKDGLQYQIVESKGGKVHPKEGDVITMHLVSKVGDSIVFDSWKINNNEPVSFPLTKASFKGDWPEGMMLLGKGDSAIFKVPIDSIEKLGVQLLPFMKKGDFLTMHVRLIDFKSQEAAQQEAMSKSKEQDLKDAEILAEYLNKNNLKPTQTNSGMYYLVEQEGTGELIKPGQKVRVNYTGRTLDGNVFDSNQEPKGEPIEFTVGQGQVIRGWDEAMGLLKKGSKAKLFIPSSLAYGPSSPSPNLPANSILTFDVEIVDVK